MNLPTINPADWCTTRELALALGIKVTSASVKCSKGHVPGAVQIGQHWLIPAVVVEQMRPRSIQARRHGTRSCYVNTRCRCDLCRAAHNAYARKRYRDRQPKAPSAS